jgi:predicted dehydrogenase
LAPTLADAKKFAALEKAGKIAIVVNHERRFSADYIKAKKILDGGRLGALLSVRAALYMGRGRRLLDVLWHDGTHLADAAMFLSGCTLKHRASFGAPLEGRKGTAWLEGALVPEKKAAGIPFVMEIGAGRDHLVFELEFSCERGRLRIGNGIFEAWESAESPYAAGFRSLAKTEEGFAGPTGYFVNMMKDAARCAQQNARAKKIFLHSQSNSLDGLKVIVYLNAVRSWTG